MAPHRHWHVVLPVKGGRSAKSRLVGATADLPDLALAMALDCLDAVLATPGVTRAVVVTDDAVTARAARRRGARPVAPGPGARGLDGAVARGLASCPDGRAVAVLLADVPALRPQDLRRGLDAVEAALDDGAGWVVVPDAEGTGTVLLAGRHPALLRPAFGPGSAAAHTALGARRLDLPVQRLRRDVDTVADLEEAVSLGVGPRTRRSLASVQATVLTYDTATRSGTVVTDDGVRLEMPAASLEGSGLRHLRPGQRVTCVRDDGAVADVHVVGISG